MRYYEAGRFGKYRCSWLKQLLETYSSSGCCTLLEVCRVAEANNPDIEIFLIFLLF